MATDNKGSVQTSWYKDTVVFRMWFRAALAMLAVIGAGAFLWMVCFTKDAEMSKQTGIVVGFVIGTLLTTVFAYYFGSSEGNEKSKPEGGPDEKP